MWGLASWASVTDEVAQNKSIINFKTLNGTRTVTVHNMKKLSKKDLIEAIVGAIAIFGVFFLWMQAAEGQSRPTFKDSVYKAQSTKVKVQPLLTPYKWEDSKGNQYPIYMGSSGACFVYRISKNGNQYKQYLGEEISRDICLKMGVAYTPKNKKGGEK